LKRARDASPAEALWLPCRGSRTPDPYFPAAWFLKAREAVDERGLAGSVGADQTENLVPRQPEVDVSDGQKAAKSDRHVIGDQIGGIIWGSPFRAPRELAQQCSSKRHAIRAPAVSFPPGPFSLPHR